MDHTTSPRAARHRPVRRWVRRTAKTLGAVVAFSGFVSCSVLQAGAELSWVDHPALDLVLVASLLVFVVSGTLGALWAGVVLARQLALRLPRRRALRRWAAANGWEWYARGSAIPMTGTIPQMLDHVRPGPPGHTAKPRYSELLRGTYAGREAVAFHFERGASYELEVEQLVAVALPRALPELHIVDRAEDPFGVEADHRFESERFNHMWRVSATDARYASAFTHPRMMELLNGLDPSITEIRLHGAWLTSHAPTAFTTDLLVLHLDALTRVADAVPAWVWEEYGGRVRA